MPTLQSILAEVQALDTAQVEGLTAAIAQVVADLNTLIANQQPPVCPTVVSSVTTFSDGSTQSLPPAPPVPEAPQPPTP